MSDLAVRLKTTIILIIILATGFVFHDAVLTRAVLCLCATFAYVEWLYRFGYTKPCHTAHIFIIIVVGSLCIPTVSRPTLGLTLLAAFGYDCFAYLGGKIFGHRLFQSCPFPKTSPKKTWEGIIFGIVMSLGLCALLRDLWIKLALWVRLAPPSQTFWFLRKTLSEPITLPIAFDFIGGPIAALGDYLGSHYKRHLGIQDSNIDLTKNLLPGHGGFIDRFLSFFAVIIAAALLSILF